MASIIPKLNLNKTPNIVDSNSLIFAKNIRLDVDGSIHKDYGIIPLTTQRLKDNDEEVIKVYYNLAYRLIHDINVATTDDSFIMDYYSHFDRLLKMIINYENYIDEDEEAPIYGRIKKSDFRIVGNIPDSNDFYLFCYGFVKYTDEDNNPVEKSLSCIVKYSEATKLFLPCNCNWSYSGGKIEGCVVNNLVGETILNIGEIVEDGTLVPFKCINLNNSKYTDDESLYTQAPNIPIINLGYNGTFSYVIPNGVYQFFIRYKVKDDFYTDWFPASKEIFAGNTNSVVTNFGTLKYLNTHKDSDQSFIFNVECLVSNHFANYESFQIGFILSHDDAIYGRAWKHFKFNQTSIKFDYNAKDAEEVEITEFTKPTFQLFNVGNVTSFKNKLYVSNYTETNFNEDLQDIANDVSIRISEATATRNAYNGISVTEEQNGSNTYITGLESSPSIQVNKLFKNTNNDATLGIIDELIKTANNNVSVQALLNNSVKTTVEENDAGGNYLAANLYGFKVWCNRDTLQAVQNGIANQLRTREDYVSGPVFENNNVIAIKLDNRSITIRADINDSIDEVISRIGNTIKYLTFDGQFLAANYSQKNTFVIELKRRCKYTKKVFVPNDADSGDTPIAPDEPINLNEGGLIPLNPSVTFTPAGTWTTTEETVDYIQKITITFEADKKLIETNNVNKLINYSTLIPYQKYKFYIHFVRKTGEITNGYYCGGENAGEIQCPYKDEADAILYPIFSNITIPDGYIACFFSIFHSSIISATVFGVRITPPTGTTLFKEARCVEANLRLIPTNAKIPCKQDGNSFEGTYHYSSDSSRIRYFGGDGIISFGTDDNIVPTKLLYAVTDYESQQEVDVVLTKCTPFISKGITINPNTGEISYNDFSVTYDNYTNLNLLGYICQYSPLDHNRVIDYYSDGNTVLKKVPENAGSGGVTIGFSELNKYGATNNETQEFGLVSTSIVNIYSNYNLNYLTLSEEPKNVITTYYPYADDESIPTGAVPKSVIWRLLSSMIFSDVYSLPSMYNNYTRKTYSPYTNDNKIRFDNTIRSSILIDDEAKLSVFKFNADDYYNVPTNRGIIVNMISIGDAILVHTKDSMFRFSGSNTLTGSTGEITTTETDVFDTGISEIFGSDFGFAGLQNKDDAIVTENGYIFFDKDSKIVYMYSGQNQIVKISESIEKIFEYDEIKYIHFANDFYNNRFFMCIIFADNRSINLSFNTLEHSKSFVSIHDFAFPEAFNTKTNCYFLAPNYRDVCTIDKRTHANYEVLTKEEDKLYPIRRNGVYYECEDGLSGHHYDNKLVWNHSSIVDVIVNVNYETVKTLNSIEWCSDFIDKVFSDIDSDDVTTYLLAEPKKIKKPCDYIRIYTDTTATKLLDCRRMSNDFSISQVNTYKYPRFNQGKWSLNYFRNILNTDDKFNYLSQYKDSRDDANGGFTPQYRSDNNSLIEGKYFVIRFVFDGDKDFKLEKLTLNIKNKL